MVCRTCGEKRQIDSDWTTEDITAVGHHHLSDSVTTGTVVSWDSGEFFPQVNEYVVSPASIPNVVIVIHSSNNKQFHMNDHVCFLYKIHTETGALMTVGALIRVLELNFSWMIVRW